MLYDFLFLFLFPFLILIINTLFALTLFYFRI